MRALESLVRLCQAHARLMYKDVVHLFDAITVIIVMESAFDSGLLTEFPLHEFILFDEEDYEYIKEVILAKLGVEITDQDLLDDEKEYDESEEEEGNEF